MTHLALNWQLVSWACEILTCQMASAKWKTLYSHSCGLYWWFYPWNLPHRSTLVVAKMWHHVLLVSEGWVLFLEMIMEPMHSSGGRDGQVHVYSPTQCIQAERGCRWGTKMYMYLRQITKQFWGMLTKQSLPLLLYEGMSHGLTPLFFPPLL